MAAMSNELCSDTRPPGASTFKPIIMTNAPDLKQGEKSANTLSMGRKKLQKCCTDPDANIVLSNCATFLAEGQEPTFVGNVMAPGYKIATFSVDMRPEDAEEAQ
ncbi:uncharacterized protein LOC115626124 [Scaptodrosophila lebanonensis]|uniref:Uncharacterized protein LOC115626124 n=1 Tax=Drosophila lebanonensis TaxID=7225 RepID=A0A6J2TQ52_DROLE|nr:uncharacterized protein LOC115626124 [Scaptodrosophila lebanonensis]